MKINWKIVLKVFVGIITVPLSVAGMVLWPWWSKQKLSIKIASSIVVFPVVLLAMIATSFFDNLKG
jgi:hypothetical protein